MLPAVVVPAPTASVSPPRLPALSIIQCMSRPKKGARNSVQAFAVLPSSQCGSIHLRFNHHLMALLPSNTERPTRTKLHMCYPNLQTATTPINVRVLARGMLRCPHSLLFLPTLLSPFHRQTARQLSIVRSFGACSLSALHRPSDWWISQTHLRVGFELRAHDCVKHQYPAEDHHESHPELVDEGVEPVVRVCDPTGPMINLRVLPQSSAKNNDATKEGFPSGVEGHLFSPSRAVRNVKEGRRVTETRPGVLFVGTAGNSIALRQSRDISPLVEEARESFRFGMPGSTHHA